MSEYRKFLMAIGLPALTGCGEPAWSQGSSRAPPAAASPEPDAQVGAATMRPDLGKPVAEHPLAGRFCARTGRPVRAQRASHQRLMRARVAALGPLARVAALVSERAGCKSRERRAGTGGRRRLPLVHFRPAA